MSDLLSARAAAEVCGVSERTVRRWVKSGQLAADKRGSAFRIQRSALEQFIGQSDVQERTTAAEQDVSAAHAASDSSVVSLELVRLVSRLQEENRVMAGRIGWLEAQIEHLKALPAADTLQDAPGEPTDGMRSETSDRASEPKRAWWRFW